MPLLACLTAIRVINVSSNLLIVLTGQDRLCSGQHLPGASTGGTLGARTGSAGILARFFSLARPL